MKIRSLPARGAAVDATAKVRLVKVKVLGASVKESGSRGLKNIMSTSPGSHVSIAGGRSVKMESVCEKFVFCSCHNSITQRTSAVSENAIGKTTVRVASSIE